MDVGVCLQCIELIFIIDFCFSATRGLHDMSFVDTCRYLVNNPSRLLMMPIILIMRINVMNKTYLQLWLRLTDTYLLTWVFIFVFCGGPSDWKPTRHQTPCCMFEVKAVTQNDNWISQWVIHLYCKYMKLLAWYVSTLKISTDMNLLKTFA